MFAFADEGQGLPVGEKKSSHAITEEYAKADPIYVAKTAVCFPVCQRGGNLLNVIGVAADLFSLSTYTRGWKLWMAG